MQNKYQQFRKTRINRLNKIKSYFQKKGYKLAMKGIKQASRFNISKSKKTKEPRVQPYFENLLLNVKMASKIRDVERHIDEYNLMLKNSINQKESPNVKKYYPIDKEEYLKDAKSLPEGKKLPDPLKYLLTPERMQNMAKDAREYLGTHINMIDSNKFKEFLQIDKKENVRLFHIGRGHGEETIKKAEAQYDKEEKEYHTHYYNEAQKLKGNIKKYEDYLNKYPQIANDNDLKQLKNDKQRLNDIESVVDITKVELAHTLENDFKLGLAEEIAKEGNDLMDAIMSAKDKYTGDKNKPSIPARSSSKNNPKTKQQAKDDINIQNKEKAPKIPKRSSSLDATKSKKKENMDDVKMSKTYNKNQDRLVIHKPTEGLKRSQSLTSTKTNKQINSKKTIKKSNSQPTIKAFEN